MSDRTRSTAVAAIFLRFALAAGFLSAVADRFGLWGPPGTPGVAWGGFDRFLAYTGKLLWYPSPFLVPVAGWAATVLEVLLAVGLVAGVRLRALALASGVLLSVFAATMTIALGPEPPLSSSVWSAAAGAFLLASLRPAPGDLGAEGYGHSFHRSCPFNVGAESGRLPRNLSALPGQLLIKIWPCSESRCGGSASPGTAAGRARYALPFGSLLGSDRPTRRAVPRSHKGGPANRLPLQCKLVQVRSQ